MSLRRMIRRLRDKREEAASKKKRRKVLFEALEPRLLLSVDLTAGATWGQALTLTATGAD